MFETRTIEHTELDAFKRSWPCHGLPDELFQLWFTYDTRGDLVDISAINEIGDELDPREFDGPALAALSQRPH